MKRRFDHTSSTSFNSNSLPQSAANSSSNPDVDDQSGVSNSNIPETVHAVGSNSSSEMQSSEQFSLSTGFQTSVAGATAHECAESESNLGHSRSSSAVHHPLSGQAHSNTPIIHSLQSNSQARVGAQMQGHKLQGSSRFEDARSYLQEVKDTFRNQPQVYNDFMDIMKKLKSRNIDKPGMVQSVSNLFKEHPELIVAFNRFVPPDNGSEAQPNDQVQVSIPDTNLDGETVSTGPTSLTILPSGPPCTSPLHTTHSQSNHASHDTSPHSSPEMAVNKRKTPRGDS